MVLPRSFVIRNLFASSSPVLRQFTAAAEVVCELFCEAFCETLDERL